MNGWRIPKIWQKNNEQIVKYLTKRMLGVHVMRVKQLLISREIVFEIGACSNLGPVCDHGTWTSQTDGRTDRHIV